MKKSLCIVALAIIPLFAERTISLSIGPTWPGNNPLITDSESSTAWNTSAEWAFAFDNYIAIGAKADFAWHSVSIADDDSNSDDNSSGIDLPKIESQQRIFMFPLSLSLALSPLPQYRLHPVARGQVGYNSLVINYTDYSEDENQDDIKEMEEAEGYYNGIMTKIGIDAVFDIGPQSSLFGGFEYQIATVDNNTYEIDMNAPALRFGISVYY
jgi:hypothetical protein